MSRNPFAGRHAAPKASIGRRIASAGVIVAALAGTAFAGVALQSLQPSAPLAATITTGTAAGLAQLAGTSDTVEGVQGNVPGVSAAGAVPSGAVAPAGQAATMAYITRTIQSCSNLDPGVTLDQAANRLLYISRHLPPSGRVTLAGETWSRTQTDSPASQAVTVTDQGCNVRYQAEQRTSTYTSGTQSHEVLIRVQDRQAGAWTTVTGQETRQTRTLTRTESDYLITIAGCVKTEQRTSTYASGRVTSKTTVTPVC
jgi:hypothetical protein